ncbi:hypothetical protein EVAR_13963_1 [Eumeta japonica]|uniref:Uncharacterized protein n=1 Tax=Eumeta variegata TaxID=151549 RepID=A0A4C1U8G8_EUMVA|nr:hypothetical protein EVAR_13963_1 [Eumeta japonica]
MRPPLDVGRTQRGNGGRPLDRSKDSNSPSALAQCGSKVVKGCLRCSAHVTFTGRLHTGPLALNLAQSTANIELGRVSTSTYLELVDDSHPVEIRPARVLEDDTHHGLGAECGQCFYRGARLHRFFPTTRMRRPVPRAEPPRPMPPPARAVLRHHPFFMTRIVSPRPPHPSPEHSAAVAFTSHVTAPLPIEACGRERVGLRPSDRNLGY